ncbi:MAG: tol-pal system protein YbgF [Deltaproteobacteria bacterium]|nr:tol-pal system protein YbgF [Deltaproteobacteria bacterium]
MAGLLSLRWPSLLGTGALLWFCTAGCSSNQELLNLQSQVADLQRQVLVIQKQMPNREDVSTLSDQIAQQREAIVRANADEDVRIQSLTALVEQLKQQLDDDAYRLAQLSQQLAATNQELKAARTSAQVLGRSLESADTGSSGEDPETLYRAAYNDYLRGNYELAIQQFQEYISAFADTELADNAVYWLGECFYRQGKYRLAVGEFDNLINRYPKSDKTPSALLKKGYAYLELNERAQGILQLQHVIREFEGSDEANLSHQRLRELGVDGG